ncbi:MAG: nuclear transport factor 2 family protein [Chloroflexi bacterium]|nr:nuclear transport factor 2 family protein [Chloroflexota bacterium]
MNTAEAVSAWVDAWSDGWARHDPVVIAARYAPDCVFRSQPFRAAGRGRQAAFDYAAQSFGGERSARFAFGAPVTGANGRAAVEYRAVITASDGTVSTIAGTSMLRFGGDGLVTEHLDTWTEAEGDLGIAIRPEASR